MIRIILIISIFHSCSSAKKNTSKMDTSNTIEKSNEEWKKLLTPEQYHVLREAGTERPGTSPLNNVWEDGIYVCAACETPLYESDRKFNAGCGWPSFDKGIDENIKTDVDYKIGYARTELRCKTCDSHLGHVFNDGPAKTTGKRHCLNGVALKFIPKEEKINSSTKYR